MPNETYDFSRSSGRLLLAGVSPLSVLEVLHGGQVVRRHIGSSLQVFGRDRSGVWLAVALVEIEDDEYEVFGARYMDSDEIVNVEEVRRWKRDGQDEGEAG